MDLGEEMRGKIKFLILLIFGISLTTLVKRLSNNNDKLLGEFAEASRNSVVVLNENVGFTKDSFEFKNGSKTHASVQDNKLLENTSEIQTQVRNFSPVSTPRSIEKQITIKENKSVMIQGPLEKQIIAKEKTVLTTQKTLEKKVSPLSIREDFSDRNMKDLLNYQKVCSNLDLKNVVVNSENIYIDKKLKYIACVPPKIGSTSWLSMVGKMYQHTFKFFDFGIFSAKTGIIHYHDIPDSEKENTIENYTKVIKVRHPWYRLVSAYKDKIPTRVYRLQKILSNANNSIAYSTKYVESFSDFVQYLIDIEINVYKEYKIIGDSFFHFSPIYILCDTCKMKYNFIQKLEFIQNDMSYINKNVFHKRVGLEKRNSISGNKLLQTQNLMKQLSESRYQQLLKMYQLDFDLFNYDPNIYQSVETCIMNKCQ